MKVSIYRTRLYIDAFTTDTMHDWGISDYFAPLSPKDRIKTLNRLIETGWVASQIGQARLNADYFERVTQEWTSKLAVNFEQSGMAILGALKTELNPHDGSKLVGQIAASLKDIQLQFLRELNEAKTVLKKHEESIDDHLNSDRKDSHISLFMDALEQRLKAFSESIDPKIDGSVINTLVKSFDSGIEQKLTKHLSNEVLDKLRNDLSLEIRELKNALIVEKSILNKTFQIEGKTTIKGANFEAEVFATLNLLASYRSDVVTYVGNNPGIDSSKKGDFVYEDVLTHQMIAIEAKDLSSRLSVSKVDELIKGSMKNRGALFGIFVCKDMACLPECFGNFFIGEDHIACTQEYLEIAVKAAILFLRRDRKQVNPDRLKNFITSIQTEVGAIDEIIKASCSAKKAAYKSEEIARDLKDALDLKIQSILGPDEKKEEDHV